MMAAYWQADSQRRNIQILVLGVWLFLLATLFWVFQFQHMGKWVTFDGQSLKSESLVQGEALSVVHFVDESCPCTKFSQPHIEQMELEWRARNVEFLSVRAGEIQQELSKLARHVPASPAVGLWREGELIYFGAYTSGVICGEGTDLLATVLTSAVVERDKNETSRRMAGQTINQEAVGCFCAWPEVSRTI